MGAVASAVSNAVDTVVSTVGNAVSDVGTAINDNVVKPVVKAVDNTIKAAEADPLNTAIRVASFAIAGPAGLAIANGTIALAGGASLQDAALTAGKSYAVGYVGGQVGQAAGAAASEAGYGVAASNAASGAASGLTQSELKGGDATAGTLLGGLGGLNATAAKEISDQQLSDWSQQQGQQAYNNAPSPTEQDVLAADPSIQSEAPLSTASNDVPSEQVAPLSNDAVTAQSPTDTTVAGNQPTTPTDQQPGSYDPMLTVDQMRQGLNFATNAIVNNALGASTAKKSPYSLGSTIGAAPKTTTPTTGNLSPNLLSADDLTANSTGDPYYLAQLHQLYSSLTPDMQKLLASNNGQAPDKKVASQSILPEATMPDSPLTMASGGSTDSAWTNLANSAYKGATTATNQPQFIAGGTKKPFQLTPLTQLSNQLAHRKHGGALPTSHPDIPHGHNPEFVTGNTGFYANGRGTGQSDEIPAVLYDGDYVIDADTVAAFGDGSSKAGAEALDHFRKKIPVHAESGGHVVPAQIADGEYVLPAAFVTALGHGDNRAGAKILDAMRKQIREHKRSAPASKIPPKAKSPIDYIKMGMKG